MENIQEKTNRLVTCCRICSVLGLGQISMELNNRYAIEKNGRATYLFSSFKELEAFLEGTLMHRSEKNFNLKDQRVNRRRDFLKKYANAGGEVASIMIPSSI